MKLYYLRLILLLLSFGALAETEIYEQKEGNFRTFGDLMNVALPAAGILGSAAIQDYEGTWQASQVTALDLAVVHSIKLTADRTRPDGSANNSFPSGHTSAAFSGAAFISHRYGSIWYIPMYSLASLTGASRVWANRHYLDDVIAGASLGVFSSLLITTPYNDDNNTRLLPVLTPDGRLGLEFNYNFDTHYVSNTKNKNSSYRYYYELIMAAAETKENDFRATAHSPFDSINLADFDHEQQPANYAMVVLGIQVTQNQYIELRFVPFETRDTKLLAEDFRFADEVYTSGTKLISAYQAYTFMMQWGYKFFSDTNFILHSGAGLVFQSESLRFDDYDGGQLTEAKNLYVWPEVSLKIGYRFFSMMDLVASGFAHKGEQNTKQIRFLTQLIFNIGERWTLGAIYGQSQSQSQLKIDDQADYRYERSSEYHYTGLSIGYKF